MIYNKWSGRNVCWYNKETHEESFNGFNQDETMKESDNDCKLFVNQLKKVFFNDGKSSAVFWWQVSQETSENKLDKEDFSSGDEVHMQIIFFHSRSK